MRWETVIVVSVFVALAAGLAWWGSEAPEGQWNVTKVSNPAVIDAVAPAVASTWTPIFKSARGKIMASDAVLRGFGGEERFRKDLQKGVVKLWQTTCENPKFRCSTSDMYILAIEPAGPSRFIVKFSHTLGGRTRTFAISTSGEAQEQGAPSMPHAKPVFDPRPLEQGDGEFTPWQSIP